MTLRNFIAIYTIVLAMLAGAFLWYADDSVRQYEHNQLPTFMAHYIEQFKVPADDTPHAAGMAFLAEQGLLSCKLVDGTQADEEAIFDVCLGEEPLLRVTLHAADHVKRLAILSYNKWEVKKVQMLKEDGLFDYTLTLPYSYQAEVNGHTLTPQDSPDSLQLTGFDAICRQQHLAFPTTYQVKGLTDAPKVRIRDAAGKDVACELQGLRLEIEAPCKEVADEDAARSMIENYPDVQEMARQWSLFLSGDLHGGNRGYDQVRTFLVEGTYLCHYALHWAQSVDITYVGHHGFEKERFTNEHRTNFRIYSSREFSCDVSLNKNLHVAGTLVDKMRERIHFIRLADNTWHILSMHAIAVKD